MPWFVWLSLGVLLGALAGALLILLLIGAGEDAARLP